MNTNNTQNTPNLTKLLQEREDIKKEIKEIQVERKRLNNAISQAKHRNSIIVK